MGLIGAELLTGSGRLAPVSHALTCGLGLQLHSTSSIVQKGDARENIANQTVESF